MFPSPRNEIWTATASFLSFLIRENLLNLRWSAFYSSLGWMVTDFFRLVRATSPRSTHTSPS